MTGPVVMTPKAAHLDARNKVTWGGRDALQSQGLSFFLSTEWNPVENRYGALAPIYGTVVTAIIAMLVAVPVSFGIAVFLTEVAPRWMRGPVGTAIELLAGILVLVGGAQYRHDLLLGGKRDRAGHARAGALRRLDDFARAGVRHHDAVAFKDNLPALFGEHALEIVGGFAQNLTIDNQPVNNFRVGWSFGSGPPVDHGPGVEGLGVAGLVLAFVGFRLLDIVKPGPVGWADRQPGAFGIMADDILAGAGVALTLLAARWAGAPL